ncbi:nucleotide exchange factor GrpE [Thiococcus pfennigii]|uniref:nucleotide exchange factor GrpE n=1 Tax=Thiococcus pfennigii TaxID=1057 RepID=UPI00190511A2|nr:nucleotide exchange factor GrpE [Thiococcus pfennigii]MBK1701677.1 nucleotide exchange factor GrpE [Thiococcus pfennigii]MBK1731843.1 nucleotide exchange factor GrpE [Thiococcus pfennigii]
MTKEHSNETPSPAPEEAEVGIDNEAAAADPGDTQPSGDVAGEDRGAAGGEALSALLEDARAKADEHWNQLLRARAEIENLRRRQAAELEKAHKFALDGFVRELLQVRDSLELGRAAATAETADLAKLREGTELTLKLLADVMGKFGVEPVDPAGAPFDPEFHQAISMQPRDDVPPGTVVTVIQKGYLLNGRLVRPALVVVSQQPS